MYGRKPHTKTQPYYKVLLKRIKVKSIEVLHKNHQYSIIGCKITFAPESSYNIIVYTVSVAFSSSLPKSNIKYCELIFRIVNMFKLTFYAK